MVAAHAEGKQLMTTSERATKIKFHIEYMLFSLTSDRVKEAQQHVEKAFDLLQDLIDTDEE
jgi:hypothetical protein